MDLDFGVELGLCLLRLERHFRDDLASMAAATTVLNFIYTSKTTLRYGWLHSPKTTLRTHTSPSIPSRANSSVRVLSAITLGGDGGGTLAF